MVRKRAVTLYICTISTAAAVAVGSSLVSYENPPHHVITLSVIYFLAASLISALRLQVSASLGSIIVMAAYPIVGWEGATLVVTVGLLVHAPGASLSKHVYNGAQEVLCTWVGGLVYYLLDGPVVYGTPQTPITADKFYIVVGTVAVADVVWLLTNVLLLSGIMRLTAGTKILTAWRNVFAPTFLPFVGYGMLGVLLATLWADLGPVAGVLIFLPLGVARWAFAQYEAEKAAHEATLRTFAQAVETKDVYTRGHSERVSKGVLALGDRLGLDHDRVRALGYAGLLHDVGKIGVPTRVIRKSGPLDAVEFAAIQLHPARGVDLVGPIAFLDEARTGILHHHERYDGTGYPAGLNGDHIPHFARIIAVVDAFDSMTTLRSYRAARTLEEALAELERCRRTHFDPSIVDGFVAEIKENGWEVPKPPAEPVAGGRVEAYDHDDPAMWALMKQRMPPAVQPPLEPAVRPPDPAPSEVEQEQER